jgi:hypothetical protein
MLYREILAVRPMQNKQLLYMKKNVEFITVEAMIHVVTGCFVGLRFMQAR